MPVHECFNTAKSQEILHPTPVPLTVWNQIGIDVFGPLKGTDVYKCIVTSVGYTCLFRQSFKRKKIDPWNLY